MSAGANIVLPDAQTTPVNHTFAWNGNDAQGVSSWEDRAGGIPVGYNLITISLTPPKRPRGNAGPATAVQATGVYRCRVQVKTPIMEVVNPSTYSGIQPAPTLSYQPMVDIMFVLPERSSSQARKDLLKYVTGLLANSQVVGAIHDLDLPR